MDKLNLQSSDNFDEHINSDNGIEFDDNESDIIQNNRKNGSEIDFETEEEMYFYFYSLFNCVNLFLILLLFYFWKNKVIRLIKMIYLYSTNYHARTMISPNWTMVLT
jgi:hypothetical protein